MIYRTKSAKETQKIAAKLALKISNTTPKKHAVVLALEGELGAGKTTFVKGFAKALGVKSHITSPTFVLMKHYPIKLGSSHFKLLAHIDAYRLKDYRDLIPLGARELMSAQENVILVEWSERVKPVLPEKYIKIHIDHIEKNVRKMTIT